MGMWKNRIASAVAVLLGAVFTPEAFAAAGQPVVVCIPVTLQVNGVSQEFCAPGWQPKLLNALSTTLVQIGPAGARSLSLLQCYNPNSSQAYVQVFNAVSTNVTLGTTVPVLSIPIAGTSTGGWAMSLGAIGQFSTGLTVAATTTATGNSAPGTALDCNAGWN